MKTEQAGPTTYSRISPWPDEYLSLASTELPTLGRLWQERKGALEKDGRLEPFLRRLKREWAIETGLIERLYTWDRGVTEVLIQQGIDSALIAHHTNYGETRASKARDLILDQEAVLEGLFEFVKGDRGLTEHYIRSVHQALTEHQESTEALNPETGLLYDIPLLRGQYKQTPNNPRRTDGTMHPYCPPELVKDEMQELIRIYNSAPPDLAPEVLSAWLHHRFTQIHPFQDGNGRVARALASLVFLKAGLFPLVMRDADRTSYIDSLEKADAGELGPLVTLFARRQRDAIMSTLSVERTAEKADTTNARMVASAIDILRGRTRRREAELARVFQTADRLDDLVRDRFATEATVLDHELAEVQPLPGERPYNAEFKNSTAETSFFYRRQVIETARELDYFANMATYHRWARLSMQTGSIFELVVSIHGVGQDFMGVLVASAFTDKKYRGETGNMVFEGLASACADKFQFNYLEEPTLTEQRFLEWLDEVVTLGLVQWRRSLEG